MYNSITFIQQNILKQKKITIQFFHIDTLFATSIYNDRKMRPIHSVIQNIRFYCRNPGEEKNLNFNNGPLSSQYGHEESNENVKDGDGTFAGLSGMV